MGSAFGSQSWFVIGGQWQQCLQYCVGSIVVNSPSNCAMARNQRAMSWANWSGWRQWLCVYLSFFTYRQFQHHLLHLPYIPKNKINLLQLSKNLYYHVNHQAPNFWRCCGQIMRNVISGERYQLRSWGATIQRYSRESALEPEDVLKFGLRRLTSSCSRQYSGIIPPCFVNQSLCKSNEYWRGYTSRHKWLVLLKVETEKSQKSRDYRKYWGFGLFLAFFARARGIEWVQSQEAMPRRCFCFTLQLKQGVLGLTLWQIVFLVPCSLHDIGCTSIDKGLTALADTLTPLSREGVDVFTEVLNWWLVSGCDLKALAGPESCRACSNVFHTLFIIVSGTIIALVSDDSCD
jgi:hypothetical protein